MPDTDHKRMLEMAAKAAGMPVLRSRLHDKMHRDFLMAGGGSRNPVQAAFPWNPLTDDGDALRLAVKLRLEFEWWKNGISVNRDDLPPMPIEHIGLDPAATTRTAIVRAAAAIGEQKP